jgi:hypothetical protein
MYCPDCATWNDRETRYCRQCGCSLAGVQLTLEGRVDEAIANFKKSENLLGLGLAIFALVMIIAFILLFTVGPIPFSFLVMFALALAAPLVLTGFVKIDRVRRLLDRSVASPKQIPEAKKAQTALEAARSTDQLQFGAEPRGSVTDRTTLNLDQHKPTNHK